MKSGMLVVMRRLLVAAAAWLLVGTASAAPGCNGSNIFGAGLITDICWSCLLPIRVLGFGGGPNDPPNANKQPVCACPDDLGVPRPGFTLGAWLPYRLFEVVRNPYCMPALGGIFLRNEWLALAGPGSTSDAMTMTHGAYFHTHIYSFPLATMLNLVLSMECNAGGFKDMDIIMMSEFDPTAADEMLGMFIYFETALFANPVAIAACAVECGSLSAGIPPSSAQMWWCAGCWGGIYPLANRDSVQQGLHTTSSLISTKQLAVKHRRGLGHRTYGDDALCGGYLSPFLPKEQYRWQHLFPVPQANKPCCHWTGVSEYVTGGVSRQRPFVGEDAIQLLFRYTDCCMQSGGMSSGVF